jgi:protein O-mannosyl-transferase
MSIKINIRPGKLKLIVYIVLTLVTLAVYWQVNQFDFVNIDDNIYVTENSHIQSGITLDGIRWALSSKYFHLWNPLVWLSFMFDYQLYGLNAGGYHVTNLILHILSTLLLFWLFHRMTGAIWKSAFVAALFALHPLHVESVAWVAERKDVLSAFFWMLTLCLYVYYTERPAIRRYLPVLFCFVLALLSKPMVVTLPLILILLDYWPLNRFESQKGNLFLWQLKEKIPLFVLSIFLVIITFYSPNEQDPFLQEFPLSSRLANAPVSFVTYLAKTFWPHDLAVYYPFSNQIPLWQVSVASLLIIIISVIVILIAKRWPHLFVGWFWYAITLDPVIGLIRIGHHSMADRYHYLPSIGIAVMLAWGIPSLIKSENIRRKILFPAAIVFLAIMSVLTCLQCGYWKDSVTLFGRTLQVTKNNYIAHNHFASALFKKRSLEKAIYHYNEAIRINPVYAHAYYNRGIVYYTLGQKQLALEDFKQAIRIIPNNPNYAEAYNNLGVTYTDLGHHQLAIENYAEAIRLRPDYAEAWNNRAFVYLSTKNMESGCRDAQKACALGNCSTLQAAKSKGLCR